MKINAWIAAPVTELPQNVIDTFKALKDKDKLKWEHELLSVCTVEQAIVRRKQLGLTNENN